MTEENFFNLNMNSKRASRAQFEAMLNYIEERPHMVNRPSSGRSRTKCIEDWEQLAIQLNSMMSGVTKTPFKWSRCWIDWKCSTRKKYASILQNKGEEGEGSNATLNDLEIRLLPFIADSVITGENPVPDMDGTSTFIIKTPSKNGTNFERVNVPEDDLQDHTYVSVIKQENSRETLIQQKDVSGSPTIVKISRPKRNSQEKYIRSSGKIDDDCFTIIQKDASPDFDERDVLCTNLDDYCSPESNNDVSDEEYLPKEKRKRRSKTKENHVNKDSRLKDSYQELLKLKAENEKVRLKCEMERLKLMKKEIKLTESSLRLKRGNRFRCSNVTYPLLKF